MKCWLCEEFKECPWPICKEQDEIQKRLREEWDGEKPMTQKEIQKLIEGFKK